MMGMGNELVEPGAQPGGVGGPPFSGPPGGVGILKVKSNTSGSTLFGTFDLSQLQIYRICKRVCHDLVFYLHLIQFHVLSCV